MNVFFEAPDERDESHSAICWLPGLQREDVRRYNPIETDYEHHFPWARSWTSADSGPLLGCTPSLYLGKVDNWEF